MGYKFETEEEYQIWCQSIVTQLYYANITGNNENVAKAVKEVAGMLHVREGDTLLKQ